MLLQTNSYIVPKDKRSEHARLMRRFRQVLAKMGCDQFEIYEQVGANWSSGETNGRFVQIMRFRDRKHQMAVQNAERSDPAAQALITEFCELVNFPYQQQQGYFAVGFYTGVLSVGTKAGEPAELNDAADIDSALPEEGVQDDGTPMDHEVEFVDDALPEEGDAGVLPTEEELANDQAIPAQDPTPPVAPARGGLFRNRTQPPR